MMDESESNSDGVSEPVSALLDEQAEQVLKAVWDNAGGATTSEIRKETGLERHVIHYRYDKLEEAGLIELGEADSATRGRGLPPKVAELTDEGVAEIESGLLGDEVFDSGVSDEVSVSRSQFREFRDELQRVENQVQVLVDESRGVDEQGDDEGGTGEGGVGVDGEEVAEARAEVRELREEFERLERDVAELEKRLAGMVDEQEWLQEELKDYEPLFIALFDALEQELGVDARTYVSEGNELQDDL